MKKWVYSFEEGNRSKRSLLGNKGANLAEMARNNLPVPPGFIVTADACNAYIGANRQLPPDLWEQVKKGLRRLEEQTNRRFASASKPLFVSVRSGAPASMPGMLETILNIGFTERIVESLGQSSGTSHFGYESYIRLVDMFAKTVHGVNLTSSSTIQRASRSGLERVLKEYNDKIGQPFPQDPDVQVREAIAAVFNSWQAPRAVEYRQASNIPHDLGTAVVVQSMVFGNIGPDSGTGIMFTRNPTTGEKRLFGEYVSQVQGEPLVSGKRTPQPVDNLESDAPAIYLELLQIGDSLERIFRDIQEVEFTVENGKLWVLQTRRAKCSAWAAVRTAVDMVNEGVISREEAVQRVDPFSLSQIFSPRLQNAPPENASARGIASSPGAAVGRIALNSRDVEQILATADSAILIRESISPDDVSIIRKVAGVLTQHGGATSHAAVVARGWGKPCVVGCETLEIDHATRVVRIGDISVAQGEYVSIDGSTGLVFAGQRSLTATQVGESSELKTLLEWADECSGIQVLANANTSAEVGFARSHGILGVGLCQTEWMYHDHPFRSLLRASLLSVSRPQRQEAIDKLKHLQAVEFEAIFSQAEGRPVTVRLLAAPLDILLPVRDAVVTELAELRLSQGWDERIGHIEQTLQRMTWLEQTNPWYGDRGVRLFFTHPDLVRMQLFAIFEGASRAMSGANTAISDVRILLPNVSFASEVSSAVTSIREAARTVARGHPKVPSCRIGVSVETPRSALTIAEIVPLVDFVCFMTDSLTERVLGYDREDGGKFVPGYLSEGLIPGDPLVWFDRSGVGALMETSVRQARQARPDIEIGVCGSHLYEPEAVHFLAGLDLNYVSADMSYFYPLRLLLAQEKMIGTVAE